MRAAGLMPPWRSSDRRVERLHRMRVWVIAAVIVAGGFGPSRAFAGPVYRVATTDSNVDALAVAAGRVFWTTNDFAFVSVFSSLAAGDRRRLFKSDDLFGND